MRKFSVSKFKPIFYQEPNLYQYKLSDDGLTYGLDYVGDIPVECNDEEMSIVIPFASSNGRDRIGDFLEVQGIECDNHSRNPIAYLDHAKHSCQLPIGICQAPDGQYTVKIDPIAGVASAKIYLARNVPNFPEPERVYELYKQKLLRAGSIGYKPLEFETLPADPENGYFKPAMHLIRVELLEVSLVSLPCNQTTVAKMLTKKIYSRGIDILMQTKDMSAPEQSPEEAKSEEPKEPLGKSILKGLSHDLESIHSTYYDAASQCEQPKVKKWLDKHLAAVKSHMDEVKALHKELYEKAEDKPDEPVADTDDEHESEDEKDIDESLQGKQGKSKDKPDEPVADTDDEHESENEKSYKARTKNADKPDMRHEEENTDDLLKSLYEHLVESANHPDTPDDLRNEHIKDAEDLANGLTDAKEISEHLSKAAEREDVPNMLKAAHCYYADKCMKGMEEEEMSDEDADKVLKHLEAISNKVATVERKLRWKIN